jgi:hypothetical protein
MLWITVVEVVIWSLLLYVASVLANWLYPEATGEEKRQYANWGCLIWLAVLGCLILRSALYPIHQDQRKVISRMRIDEPERSPAWSFIRSTGRRC